MATQLFDFYVQDANGRILWEAHYTNNPDGYSNYKPASIKISSINQRIGKDASITLNISLAVKDVANLLINATFPYLLVRVLNYDELTNSTTLLFVGVISEISLTKDSIVAEAKSIEALFDLVFPRFFFQRQCNWNFGDEFCGVNINDYTEILDLSSLVKTDDPTRLQHPAFVGKSLTGAVIVINFEARNIIWHDGGNEIQIDFPFTSIPESGSFKIIEVCDKTLATCKNKSRFSGFPFPSVINPSFTNITD